MPYVMLSALIGPSFSTLLRFGQQHTSASPFEGPAARRAALQVLVAHMSDLPEAHICVLSNKSMCVCVRGQGINKIDSPACLYLTALSWWHATAIALLDGMVAVYDGDFCGCFWVFHCQVYFGSCEVRPSYEVHCINVDITVTVPRSLQIQCAS